MTAELQQIVVGDVGFVLPIGAIYCEFDETLEYRKSAGRFNHKGSDLVVIYKGDLWIVEVKNYNRPKLGKEPPSAEELVVTVGRKSLATMALLYQWQRLDEESDAVAIAQAAAKARNIHVVLHIEKKIPHGSSNAEMQLQKSLMEIHSKMRRLVKQGYLKVEEAIVSSVSSSGQVPWSTRHV